MCVRVFAPARVRARARVPAHARGLYWAKPGPPLHTDFSPNPGFASVHAFERKGESVGL